MANARRHRFFQSFHLPIGLCVVNGGFRLFCADMREQRFKERARELHAIAC